MIDLFSEHHLIDDLVKEDATEYLVEVQKKFESTCAEIGENCRLGLG